ncbi:MAG: peptidase T [Lachnospiraceae bacterium]|nr:peptidase T [Lachnospiraceae bacterium]
MAEYKDVLERFLRYVKVDTQSDEAMAEREDVFPSTEKQKDLGRMLTKELEEMGASDVYFDEKNCYVYAKIPATDPNSKTVVGFISHMDTSPAVSGKDVKPQIIENYDGEDIFLGENEDGKWILSPKDFPDLTTLKGKDIITTDGSTLLGADDKAGVAEIMTMADYLLRHPEIQHGTIAIGFTPDEEVGCGVDHFDLERFGADIAYTVDGGPLGGLEYECFNAAGATVIIKGRSVHPGDAKGKMVNAILLAAEFAGRFPANERPDTTEGYEGFYHLDEISGGVDQAKMTYIIRDHDKAKFEAKKAFMEQQVKEMQAKYGEEAFTLRMKDQYYNMVEKIEPHMELIDAVKEVMTAMDITPSIEPIRGGTDGARLSFEGLPCPNLCTGGRNYHGRFEYVCINDMVAIVEMLVRLSEKLR